MSSYYYIGVRILLHVSYCYVCVLIRLYVQAADLMASFLWKKMGQKAFVLSEQAKGPSLLARPATSPATDATPA